MSLIVRLRDVPEAYRGDLILFVERGVLPLANPGLMQILLGLEALAAESFRHRRDDLTAILKVLETECPDHAWSSIGACMRWEQRGGLYGGWGEVR